jgi:hypothetical protein
MTHDLKIDPKEFEAIESGAKRFELRLNDRNYALGDFLCLREFDRGSVKYTGRSLTVSVTHIKPGDGAAVSDRYVVMSISEPFRNH